MATIVLRSNTHALREWKWSRCSFRFDPERTTLSVFWLPHTVASGPFQLSFPLALTSAYVTAFNCGWLVGRLSQIFRTGRSAQNSNAAFVTNTRSFETFPIVLIDIAHFTLVTDQLHRQWTNRSRHLHNNFCDIRWYHGKELLWIHLERPCVVSTASAVMEKSLHMEKRGHVLRCNFSSTWFSLKISQ